MAPSCVYSYYIVHNDLWFTEDQKGNACCVQNQRYYYVALC